MFVTLFVTSFAGIVKVFAIGIVGASLLGGTRMRQPMLDALSMLFVRIALPCLIFSNMVTQFRPDEMGRWWIFPLLAIGLFAAGGLLAYLYTRLDRSVKNSAVFSSSVAFHNSIMLPLAIAPVLFSEGRLAHFLSLLFLYNLLTVPAFFTVGIWLMHSAGGTKRRLSQILNPPNIATVFGILLALTGLSVHVPGWIIEPLHMFGTLTMPLSMIIVGGIILTSIPQARGDDWADPLKIMLLKSAVLPAAACAAVAIFRPQEDIALFLLIGSAMPVGSTLAVICPPDKSIQKQVAGGILLTSVASVLALSAIMSFYTMLYG